ncbi:MAG: PaaI family thioesterase [Aestuariivirga sp.]|uniref:PaaI family thioesterase n=1 Tax=Aestuariivirga sp. TaxID=2650926 RepID=UPI0025C52F22|nr:PaaI family thioesterase [Aestuariivirga sp.]MCA3562613.1 PaaI family thioesterase [Aestuariivirga sp.]
MDAGENKAHPQSGLDFLRALLRDWHGSAMAEAMNFRLIAVDDGTATFEAFPSPKYYNPQMRLHGGYAATLIDSATGCAVQTKLPAGIGYGTIELKVNYVGKIDASVPRLICTGTVIHAGRTLLTADARLTDDNGKLYAHGSGTFLVYPKQ